MTNQFYTYAYLREDGTPYYIGKGKGKRAFKKHAVLTPPKERILFLKRNLTEEEAFKHEIYMIAVFGRKDINTGILYNFTDGGEGSSGKVLSDETKQKMSDYQSNRSEEHRKRLGESRKGSRHSKETIEKIRERKLGRKHSKDHRVKISEALKGHEVSDETRRKISEANLGNISSLGRVISEETRKKISEANKGKKRTEEHRKKLSEANKGKKQSEETILKRVETQRRNRELKKAEKVQ